MRVLLDTNALIWWLVEPRHLSTLAFQAIQGAEAVLVSAVSAYEIEFKRQKLRSSGVDEGLLFRLPRNLPATLPELGMQPVDISIDAAWHAAQLPLIHRDPWDRLLVAQSRLFDAPLVSRDADLKGYDVVLLW